jgi:transcriptional regulator with XRE-family HTH domain
MSVPAHDIRELRVNRGLSIAQAAEAIGVTSMTLNRAESGEAVPRPASAYKIARFYGFQVTDLWPLDDPEPRAAA